MSTALESLRPRPLTSEQYREKLQQFQISIRPLLKIKMKVYEFTLPTMLILENGQMQVDYHFTKGQQELLDLVDEQIKQIERSIFGASHDHA